MTIIKSLSMRGFKSFAHKIDLPFGNGFNMVIGVNGAGKSNICDALCFVLGKSSAKEMRAERSSHLIFNGGKKGKAANEAEVSVTFDNTTNLFPLQAKDVAISRIVKHNGTSVYKINGDAHTRQQVRDLLNAARIDPDGHNIILQGDIIGFMEMKPVERRMAIEQIAGISAYEEKKQKCLLELTKVDAKLNEAEIILKERETNLRELKKDRDQALHYKDLEQGIKNDKATLLHLSINQKDDELAEIEARKKEAESKLSQSHATLTTGKQKITDLKNAITTSTQELESKGEHEHLALRTSIAGLKEAIIKAASRLELVQTELGKLKSRKTALLDDMQNMHSKITAILAQKKTLENQLKSLHHEKSTLETKITQFKTKHGFTHDATQTFTNLDTELETLQERLTTLHDHYQDLLRKKDHATFKLQTIEERINALTGSVDNADVELLKTHRAQLKELDAALSKAANEDSSLAAQLVHARKTSLDYSNELAKLQGRQLSILERQTADSAVRKLLDKKTGIKGILGTIADLGKVDSPYALALEVAAGGRLHSIVVDNDATAQRCITYLKTHKIGIATFLPLTTVKARAIDEHTKKILHAHNVHGLALDLITYDKKLHTIFSYVFGSTVVVEDLDTARRIGIGRARMVTLSGDLLEPSGAMIGGYRNRAGIGFAEKDTNERSTQLENDLAKTRTLIQHLDAKHLAIEDTLRTLRAEKATLEVALLRLEKSLNVHGIDVSSLEDEKKTLLHDLKTLDQDLASLAVTSQQDLARLHPLKNQRAQLREQLATPAIAQTLETFETEKTRIMTALAETTSHSKSLEVQHATLFLPELAKAEKIIKQHDKEYEDFLQEEHDLKDLLHQREQELKTKEHEERTFSTSLRALAAKRAKISEKLQLQETTNAREEEKQHAHEQRLNNITIERAKIVAEREALHHEYSQYKDVKLVRGIAIDDLKARVSQAERDLANIGNVNLRALEVYEDIQKEHQALVEKSSTIKLEKEDILKVMHEVESKKADVFLKTYDIIVRNFKTIFSHLTTKGEVHVELENPHDPFAGGIDIQVKIANNKALDMKSLSGGEKTMAALAFIFAIQEYAPSPFYLLDEVDAALDKKNSAMLSRLIQQYAKKAQYIVVSHNDAVITEADQIYGVSMQDGVSKIVSLKI